MQVVDLLVVLLLNLLDLLLVAYLAVAFPLVEGLLVVDLLEVDERSVAYLPCRLVEDHLVECSGFRQGRPFVQVACPNQDLFVGAFHSVVVVVVIVQAGVYENVS